MLLSVRIFDPVSSLLLLLCWKNRSFSLFFNAFNLLSSLSSVWNSVKSSFLSTNAVVFCWLKNVKRINAFFYCNKLRHHSLRRGTHWNEKREYLFLVADRLLFKKLLFSSKITRVNHHTKDDWSEPKARLSVFVDGKRDCISLASRSRWQIVLRKRIET